MSTITSLNANDNGATSRGVINTNTTNLNSDKLENSSLTGATAKTTPVDADTMPINDSAASNALKKVTWANIKATAKTYFDTLYLPTTYLDTDGTLAANSDTKVASQKAVVTYVGANGFNGANFNAPQGFLLNGKITPTVTSNNITLTLKTMSGATPSAGSPVYCRIGDTVRAITGALSVTKNAGTNWFNAGSTELAAKEIDYFTYLGYNATDGVTIGFARIPYAQSYGEFSATSNNEKYCAISTITNAVSTDAYENVGRFAATLGVSASYNWSVPTYTRINLIQRPIVESRELTWLPVYTSSGTMTYTSVTNQTTTYKIVGRMLFIRLYVFGTTASTAANGIRFTVPLSVGGVYAVVLGTLYCNFRTFDTTAQNGYVTNIPANTTLEVTKDGGAVWGIGASKYLIGQLQYEIA